MEIICSFIKVVVDRFEATEGQRRTGYWKSKETKESKSLTKTWIGGKASGSSASATIARRGRIGCRRRKSVSLGRWSVSSLANSTGSSLGNVEGTGKRLRRRSWFRRRSFGRRSALG
jgi:hypothetical protein